jgi:hypothetical protein
MVLTNLFQFDGKPIVPPDCELSMRFEDLDSAQSGRDESGFMHRIVVRHKVGSWKFTYSHLTEAEKQYMESLFADASTFQFQHPSRLNADAAEVSTCYRSKYDISWKNARTGLWCGYGFSIIEC